MQIIFTFTLTCQEFVWCIRDKEHLNARYIGFFAYAALYCWLLVLFAWAKAASFPWSWRGVTRVNAFPHLFYNWIKSFSESSSLSDRGRPNILLRNYNVFLTPLPFLSFLFQQWYTWLLHRSWTLPPPSPFWCVIKCLNSP